MDRRKFLGTAAASAGLVAGGAFVSKGYATPDASLPMGIILNTVKNEMTKNYESTLRSLKEMGYDQLEGGFYGESKAAYGKYCAELGLRNVCGGSSLGNLLKDYGSYIETAEALEYEYLIAYYPWLHGSDEIDADASKVAADNLNDLGKRVKASGFRFAWHPHNWEFIPDANGQRPFDIIMQRTDPAYVALELDLYWAVKAGADPIEVMDRYPGRTQLFHVKDLSAEDESIVCVGAGTINFQEILQYAVRKDISYWFVENETDRSSLACALSSAERMKTIIRNLKT